MAKKHRFIVDPADMPGGDRVIPKDGYYPISVLDENDPNGYEVCRVMRTSLVTARKAAKAVAAALTQAGVKIKP